MAFTEPELARVESALADFLEKRRPPEEIRQKVDLAYRIEGESVVIFLLRPLWRDPTEILEHPVAKAIYQRGTHRWSIKWQRANLRWYRYDPHPEAMLFEEFLAVVDEDEQCCFWG